MYPAQPAVPQKLTNAATMQIGITISAGDMALSFVEKADFAAAIPQLAYLDQLRQDKSAHLRQARAGTALNRRRRNSASRLPLG
jgi:hypothetical protein